MVHGGRDKENNIISAIYKRNTQKRRKKNSVMTHLIFSELQENIFRLFFF